MASFYYEKKLFTSSLVWEQGSLYFFHPIPGKHGAILREITERSVRDLESFFGCRIDLTIEVIPKFKNSKTGEANTVPMEADIFF